MKKTNNKYRNNSSNNTIYSLNYKFDSNSIAGKICGTALDLIKRYNDFAKDAQSNNDYVNAEIFRQYAEHYRKIVTEINERKNQQRQAMPVETAENRDNAETTAAEAPAEKTVADQSEVAAPAAVAAEATPVIGDNVAKTPRREVRKSFKIIEISHAKADEAKAENNAEKEPVAEAAAPAPKRVYRRRTVAATS